MVIYNVSDFGLQFRSGYSIFANFNDFRNKCFALFSIVLLSCFASFQTRDSQGFAIQVSQLTFVSQDLQVFANRSLSRLRKYKFRKVLQIGFSFRKFCKVLAMGSLLMGPELTISLQAVTCLVRLHPEFPESYLCPKVTAVTALQLRSS